MDLQNILNNAFIESNKNIEIFNSINNDVSIILAGNHLNEVSLNSDCNSGFCSYINQSAIEAKNVRIIENDNNKCTRRKTKAIILLKNETIDEDNEIDILNTNIDAMSDQSEIFYDNLECKINSLPTTESTSDTFHAEKLTPLVDITSSEQRNGTFRVQIHIKGFEQDNKPMAKLKSKQAIRRVYRNLNKKASQRRTLTNFNQIQSKAKEYNNIIEGKPNFENFDNKENYDPKNITQCSKSQWIKQ